MPKLCAMQIEFQKYQGTGNDFILINDFEGKFSKINPELIQKICNRKFGVGADGLMLLQKSNHASFRLVFFNPDGSQSFCGNGSRCAVRFALENNLIENKQISFDAFDGVHFAEVNGNLVSISMRDVSEFRDENGGQFINTGSPHLVIEKQSLDSLDIVGDGRKLRYHSAYSPIGTNVNFMQVLNPNSAIKIRTYEKGVEDETLSCGTGVTACALVFARKNNVVNSVLVETVGGQLSVSFSFENGKFTNVKLKGPAKFVFKGSYNA